MARWAALVVAATTFLAVPSMADAAPSDIPQYQALAHGVSLGQFLAARAARSPSTLDWSSDGCSTPLPVGLGDTGRTYNFRAACQRHDFGYRNAKRLGLWGSAEKRRIDDRFLADMKLDCAPRPWTQRTSCLAWAAIYHQGVRIAGT